MQTDAEHFIHALEIPLDPAAADAHCRAAFMDYLDTHPLYRHEWLALILLLGQLRGLRPPVLPPEREAYVAGRRLPPMLAQRAQSLAWTVCLRGAPEQLCPSVQHVVVGECGQ